jgi:hypothetical protein
MQGAAEGPFLEPPYVDSAFAVVTSDFMSGALYAVDIQSRLVSRRIDTLDQDSGVFTYDGIVYTVDRTHGVGRRYDPQQSWREPREFPISASGLPQAQTNPHGLYLDAQRRRMLVTLYGGREAELRGDRALGVLDLDRLENGITRFIPLTDGTAPGEQNPEADRIVACGPSIYVTLQNLNRNNGYRPAGPGQIAVLDAETLSVQAYIPLVGHNPVALRILPPDCSKLLVADADYQLGQGADTLTDQGGLELVDLTARKSLGMQMTARELQGNVSAMDASDLAHVFVDLILNKGLGEYDHELVMVDLMTHKRGPRLLGPMNFVPSVHVHGESILVLSAGTPDADRQQVAAGLYVGRGDGTPLTDPPIRLGLPPYALGALQSR